jgi:hypothetical protein
VSSARPLQIQRSFEGTSPVTNPASDTTNSAPFTNPTSPTNPIPTSNLPIATQPTPITINTGSARGNNPPVVINTRPATNPPFVANNHPPAAAPAIRKQEFYEEETHSRTNVKIDRPLTPAELLKTADVHKVIVFALLVMAVTLFSILTEDDISLAYILPLVSVASLAFFHVLKL